MVSAFECPVCSDTIEGTECPSCDSDVSVLFETRRAAYRLGRVAHDYARERRIRDAAEKAERGMQLFMNEELRKLFGWLLFLDGRFGLAGRCWKSIPDQARLLIGSYNGALRAARRGASREALDKLADIQVPFRPALVLEWLCAEREGASSRVAEAREMLATAFPEAMPSSESRTVSRPSKSPPEPSGIRAWRPAPLAITGLMLLLGGAGLGYILREPPWRTSDEAEVVESPANVTTDEAIPKDPMSPASPADSLRYGWAYLSMDPGPVVEASGVRVPPEPIGEVRHIPAEPREQIAREWYLEGLNLFERDARKEAIGALRAALASVGSASDLYWVDDALYLLVRAATDSNPRLATAAAQAILTNHHNSIYANSLTRSMAAETP